jgi:hypothetical protein
MSLEQVLADQTAAIREQTAAITKLTTAFAVVAAQSSGITVPAVLLDTTATSSVAGEAATATPRPNPAADTREPAKTRRQKHSEFEVPVVPEDNKPEPEAVSVLPEGERTLEFYAEHVKPVLVALGRLDKEVLREVLKKFGAEKGDQTKPEDWDAVVIAAKALAEEVVERNKRLEAEAAAEAAAEELA